MRRVACFSASSGIGARESRADVIENLLEAVTIWLRSKGLQDWSEGRHVVARRGGRQTLATITRTSVAEDVEWGITFDEPEDGRRFLTRLLLGMRAETLHLFLEMRAGADGYQIAPRYFEVRTPRILPQLLGMRDWMVGDTLASPKAIRWHGEGGGQKFWAVLRHSRRNLPVVAISRLRGQPLTPGLADDLARELGGIAVVADLDDEASWELTGVAGKEWSCFNGAIRLYWPLRKGATSYRDCPIWTLDRLVEASGTAESAAERIRQQLRRWLFELSTYAVDEPQALIDLRAEAGRVALEALRTQAAEHGDYKAVADSLVEYADGLEKQLADEKQKVAELRAHVEILEENWRYQGYAGTSETGDIAPNADATPETVPDAVARAREQYSGVLVFGGDVEASAATVQADAGPPDKILRFLDCLAEMTRARRDGALGKDAMSWLRDRGVACSVESQTVSNNAAERARRTWDDGDGGRRFFEEHLKVSEGTSPDRCVRIYYDFDSVRKVTVVGYVGRHP